MTPSRDDFVWIAPSVAAGVAVYVVYLATNPYPAHGAGLYFTMAREVSEHGYALPRTIPYYTRGGIPFAYPPLGMYALALVRDATGVGPLALSRWLPGPVVVAALVPTYVLALELLESRPAAAFAATLVAVNPQLLDWHLTAGGVVRAPAFLFAVVGLFAGIRLFRTRARRWLVASLASFALTLLTHPTYALFLVVTYLVAFAVLDRSATGFVYGAAVGLGGLLLAAPWWLTVVRTHGPGVFLGAMGTHGGVVGGLVARVARAPLDVAAVLLVLVLATSLVLGLASGWTLLVAWLLAVSLVMSQPRFTLFVGTFLVVGVVRSVASRLRPVPSRPGTSRGAATGVSGVDVPSAGRHSPALLVGFAVVLALVVGAGFVRDDTAAPRHTVTPDHIDGTDLEAMAWARSAAPEGASFVVVGDAAEWFPLFAERTLLVSPWGAEWEGSRAHDRHVRAHRVVSTCATARCLDAALDRFDVRPDYVYVPTGPYPVHGTPNRQSGALAASLERSDRFATAFENDGVTVFRTVRSPPERRTGTEPRRTVPRSGGRTSRGGAGDRGPDDPLAADAGRPGSPARPGIVPISLRMAPT